MPTINDVARAAGGLAEHGLVRAQRPPADLGPDPRPGPGRHRRTGLPPPHAGARALGQQQTNVIALVVPLRVDVNVPVIMQFATAVVTSARTHNHDVLLLTKDEGTAGLERVANSTMVDA